MASNDILFGETGPSLPGGGGGGGASSSSPGSSQNVTVLFGGYECINPWYFNQTPFARSLRCKPNGFKNTRGEMAGHGAVLMTKANVDLLMADIASDSYNQTTFAISDGIDSVTYEHLSVYNIVSTSSSLNASDEEVFLVEFEDHRRHLIATPIEISANIFHLTESNNVSGSSVTSDLYYPNSLTPSVSGRINPGAAWTFGDIVEWCFYKAEFSNGWLVSGDIPTPLTASLHGFCNQNVYVTGSMWKVLCRLGLRSFLFFTMNPDGSFNCIEPSLITTDIKSFLDDYSSYLVYNNHADLYFDYMNPQKVYGYNSIAASGPYSPVLSAGLMASPMRTGVKSNSLTGNNRTVLLDTGQPSYYTTGSVQWNILLESWTQSYIDNVEDMLLNNPPMARSYAKLIDVDTTTGVSLVHHDCQGVGPNNEGGLFTHVINERLNFDPGVQNNSIEDYRNWYKPRIHLVSATNSFDYTDATVTTNSTIYSSSETRSVQGPDGSASTSPTTVYNPPTPGNGSNYGFSGTSGDTLVVMYDDYRDKYFIIGVFTP